MELPDSRHVHSVDDVREDVLDDPIVQTLDYPLNKLCIQLTICVYWINSIDQKCPLAKIRCILDKFCPVSFSTVKLLSND